MSRYVFDSDAWDCARKLGILGPALSHAGCVPVVLTDYIRLNELSRLSNEIEAAVSAGMVVAKSVEAADPTYRRLKKLVDKGEAEAIAWLVKTREPLVFVTRDAGAARAAVGEKVLCTDLLGLVVDLMRLQAISEEDARTALSTWDDKSQQVCRPRDWAGFDESVMCRQGLTFPYFKI